MDLSNLRTGSNYTQHLGIEAVSLGDGVAVRERV